jgi:hypothetical protein
MQQRLSEFKPWQKCHEKGRRTKRRWHLSQRRLEKELVNNEQEHDLPVV